MRYPVYIHPGDAQHAFGAIVPDFPGCFAAADDENDLTANIQEAIELFCENEVRKVPTPSRLSDLLKDQQYTDGAWVLVDIDTRRLNTRVKRYNVSLPERLVMEVDAARKDLHMSRSAFLAMVAEDKLKEMACSGEN